METLMSVIKEINFEPTKIFYNLICPILVLLLPVVGGAIWKGLKFFLIRDFAWKQKGKRTGDRVMLIVLGVSTGLIIVISILTVMISVVLFLLCQFFKNEVGIFIAALSLLLLSHTLIKKFRQLSLLVAAIFLSPGLGLLIGRGIVFIMAQIKDINLLAEIVFALLSLLAIILFNKTRIVYTLLERYYQSRERVYVRFLLNAPFFTMSGIMVLRMIDDNRYQVLTGLITAGYVSSLIIGTVKFQSNYTEFPYGKADIYLKFGEPILGVDIENIILKKKQIRIRSSANTQRREVYFREADLLKIEYFGSEKIIYDNPIPREVMKSLKRKKHIDGFFME